MEMTISDFGLTDSDKEFRKGSIGGSDATTLMSGDAERIYNLWREKRGEPVKRDPPTINQLMGHATEALNAAWYSDKTGDPVTDRQLVAKTDAFGYPAHATVDGICLAGDGVWEAKHTSGYDFSNNERKTVKAMVESYYAQLQHNMMVSGKRRAVISVFFDNSRWESETVEADDFYMDALKEAEARFWECVQSGEPPSGFQPIDAKPETAQKATREVDMKGNNEWAAAAADYLKHKAAAADFESAKKAITALVEKDVAKATGYGVMVKRDKRGALRIYEE